MEAEEMVAFLLQSLQFHPILLKIFQKCCLKVDHKNLKALLRKLCVKKIFLFKYSQMGNLVVVVFRPRPVESI